MKELDQDNLDQILKENKKVIVQYGASWCGACRLIKPQFTALEKEYQDIAFYYVDAEEFPNSRNFAKIENLPTFAGFVDEKLVKQAMGGRIEKVKEILDEITNH